MDADRPDDSHTLTVKVYLYEDSQQRWPELEIPRIRARAPVGICLSGGGSRAFSAAIGQLRALRHMGLLSRARYLSAVSGGAWAATIWSWGEPTDDDALLGPVTSPEQIRDSALKAEMSPEFMGYPATHDLLLRGMRALLLDPIPDSEAWNRSVGDVFLAGFGLYDPKRPSAISLDEDTVAEIRARPGNDALARRPFLTLRGEDRPYPIVNACVLGPDTLSPLSQENPVHLEFAPLAAGAWSGGAVTFYGHNGDTLEVPVGGCAVEPFAFGGVGAVSLGGDVAHASPRGRRAGPAGDAPGASAAETIALPAPMDPLTLSQVAGISSMAPAAVMENHRLLDRFIPRQDLWSRVDDRLASRCFVTGDGGVLENFGLLALLRRRLPRAVVFINTAQALNPEYDPKRAPDAQALDVFLPPLFGHQVEKIGLATQNNQVFSRSDFSPLVETLQERRGAGGPTWARTRLEVQDNDWWGIEGGWEVDVLWVYLERSPEWESALEDKDLLADLARARRRFFAGGPYEHFPHYRTEMENGLHLVELTPEQVRLLADLTCWTTLALERELRDLFSVGQGAERRGASEEVERR